MVVLSRSLIIRSSSMDNNTIKTVFNKYIHPIDSKVFTKMVEHTGIDKYVKKLDVLKFTKLFIYAQLMKLPSLMRISDVLKRKKNVQRIVGIEGISSYQLSRQQGDIPQEIFQVLMHHLIQQLHQKVGSRAANKALGKIHLIDSSTISMCLNQYEWAHFRETKAGVKMHTSIIFCDGESYPNEVIV